MHNIQGAMAETNSSRTEQVPTPKTVEKTNKIKTIFLILILISMFIIYLIYSYSCL